MSINCSLYLLFSGETLKKIKKKLHQGNTKFYQEQQLQWYKQTNQINFDQVLL